ncbi:MAG: hypothetical protein VB858_04080 [Planctomycetaceae bacterium]
MRGALMLNMQINNTMTASVASQADCVAGSIVRDQHERPAKHRRDVPMSSDGHLCSAACGFEDSPNPHPGGNEAVSRAAIAAGQIPAPAWGSLVVLKALMS